ncbi:MAG: sigma-70 family RNA polymerase sigma factor [Nanoarchaeota archaeon]|nr:sigma-70 family RNA polymerase sigma factor [Nanoarchaeota archaeon]
MKNKEEAVKRQEPYSHHEKIDGIDPWIDENFNQLYSEQRRTGNPELRKRLIGAHIGYAFTIADAFYRTMPHFSKPERSGEIGLLERDDLRNWGVLGLEEAYDGYDEKFYRGNGVAHFKPYAAWWIRKEISRGIHEMSEDMRQSSHNIKSLINILGYEIDLFFMEHGRQPTSEELVSVTGLDAERVDYALRLREGYEFINLDSEVEDGVSASDLIGDPRSDYIRLALENEMAIKQIFSELSESEKEMLNGRNGLTREKETFREMGERMGIDYRVLERRYKLLISKIQRRAGVIRRDHL